MPTVDIKKVRLPDGSVHEIHDENARTSLDNKADKNNPVFTGSISMGRASGSSVGSGSVAEGTNVTASGLYSHAEGSYTVAAGDYSHTEGVSTSATGTAAHVFGKYNVIDSFENIPEWVSGKSYAVNDIVKITTGSGSSQTIVKYKCKTANSDANFSSSKWYNLGQELKYVEIVGNGTYTTRSNARTLDWEGNEVVSNSITVGIRNSSYAIGDKSFASGAGVAASGANSHAEGAGSIASGFQSHAEGSGTTASGSVSHAEGSDTRATGSVSHAEGSGTTASGMSSHAEGQETNATTYQAHAEGLRTTSSNTASHAEGIGSEAMGAASHSEGIDTDAIGSYSHAEGQNSIAAGQSSHAEGTGGSYTLNDVTYESKAMGTADHVEGYQTRTAVNQPGNHAEGYRTNSLGGASHSEGCETTASGVHSHAEGAHTTASGTQSHAEGNYTISSGAQSHAEGGTTTASGSGSHSEGYSTVASGSAAHAEGVGSNASGDYSHAGGAETIASGAVSNVFGRYNVPDDGTSIQDLEEWTANTSYSVGDVRKRTITSNGVTTCTKIICKTANSDSTYMASKWYNCGGEYKYVEIVGNGFSGTARSNARTLDWDGNERLAGDLYVHANQASGGSKVLSTLDLGANNGVASLDSSGKVPSAQLPSYVDDVLEYADTTAFPQTGETGKIYVALDTNSTYRWSGSTYIELTTEIDLSSKADVNNPTFTGTMSLGRQNGSTVGSESIVLGSNSVASGYRSIALGDNNVASGQYSYTEGRYNTSSASAAHAEGYYNVASGMYSHAEGYNTTASGYYAHTEGEGTVASGYNSHAEGNQTVAIGESQHVFGEFNISDDPDEWVADTSYAVGDIVKVTSTSWDDSTYVTYYKCETANEDHEFTNANWKDLYGKIKFIEIVGNGADRYDRSNARTLDWDGNERLAGDLFIHANANGTGGLKVATQSDITGLIAVQDGTPTGETTTIWFPATASQGIQIPTYAEFQALETTVGGKVSDVQVNGTTVVNNGTANIPIASNNDFGVFKLGTSTSSYGLNVNSTSGIISIARTTTEQIKAGTDLYKPVVSSLVDAAAFYGLAKAAGADMASSSNAVGVYTPAAQAAIQTMLGVESAVSLTETVSGTTPSIVCQPNVQYICGEVSTISITPPANGSCDVIFESGSTAAVLTLPNTVKMPAWFDESNLETDTIYEIVITNGVYGSVMTWES